MTDAEVCSICLDCDVSEMFSLTRCNHTFHSFCLREWINSNKSTCPYCREEIEYTDKINTGCNLFRKINYFDSYDIDNLSFDSFDSFDSGDLFLNSFDYDDISLDSDDQSFDNEGIPASENSNEGTTASENSNEGTTASENSNEGTTPE
ncbi:hypothetical protein TNIN_179241 [Trichonephila inaurata madagascariensis]|uniref:RING-type domain-containing protein n=1 Tax=Trichonephila inaurata madagascariensis TaxID=2747483 RepID=A0A8X6Y8P3_9ARAC|nr:hypothetical protein TNIN_179241 [Trichonephila inaurata madagascariensis]